MNNPDAIKNLKPFLKGQSGNPNGRPPVSDYKKYLKERLSEPDKVGSKKTKLDALTDKLYALAIKGNVRALELLLAYYAGKPSQELQLTEYEKMSDEDLERIVEALQPKPVDMSKWK